MANLDLLMKALDTAIWEMGEAFKGLPDADVWKRAHPQLLSVGELAAHTAYWEAISFMGQGVESPLTEHESRYYTANVGDPVVLDMTAEAVYAEVKRIHELAKASFAADPQDSESPNPHREGWSWGTLIEYQVFHVAYHAGQMYSVRHLMGHATVDN